MVLYKDNKQIRDSSEYGVYYGFTPIQEIYKGSQLIYQYTPNIEIKTLASIYNNDYIRKIYKTDDFEKWIMMYDDSLFTSCGKILNYDGFYITNISKNKSIVFLDKGKTVIEIDKSIQDSLSCPGCIYFNNNFYIHSYIGNFNYEITSDFKTFSELNEINGMNHNNYLFSINANNQYMYIELFVDNVYTTYKSINGLDWEYCKANNRFASNGIITKNNNVIIYGDGTSSGGYVTVYSNDNFKTNFFKSSITTPEETLYLNIEKIYCITNDNLLFVKHTNNTTPHIYDYYILDTQLNWVKNVPINNDYPTFINYNEYKDVFIFRNNNTQEQAYTSDFINYIPFKINDENIKGLNVVG